MGCLLKHRVLIIVPAYNEAEGIGSLLDELHEHVPEAHVVVIDDASTDRTASVAGEKGVKVISLPFNLGIGGAVQTGFRYAWNEGYESAVQVDGDGQHPPEEVPRLLTALEDGKVDVVVGSRFLSSGGHKSTFSRRLGIRILNSVVSSILSQPVTDCTSGFRAYGRKAIGFFATKYPYDYPEPEALVLLKKAGFSAGEVPVFMRDRLSGKSSIQGWKPFYYMIKVVLAILVDLLKPMSRKKKTLPAGARR